MKLRNVQCYPIEGVPDYLIEECIALAQTLIIEIHPILEGKSPNIVLGAMAMLHASVIKKLVSDDPNQQEGASVLAGVALINNVKILNEKGDEFDINQRMRRMCKEF
jgi:hypothetical protein